MANQTCISIGINQYQFLPPLGYGLADAVSMERFFVDAAGWSPSQCLLLTDTSPNHGDRSTYPDRENINRWISQWSWETLHHGDLLWFFFSGCGIGVEGEDYLIPIDGNVADLQHTCISVRELYQKFKDIGVNAIVCIDANRSLHLPHSTGIGAVTAQLAEDYQIPTFLSCQSNEFSHEDAGLGHGLFTTALLEALNYHHDLNLGTIDTYLTSRLAELSEHHWKPLQTPVALLPTGTSVHRPVFSSTTQSSLSTMIPEAYTPPTPPVENRQEEYKPFIPPILPGGVMEDDYAPYPSPFQIIDPEPTVGFGEIVPTSHPAPIRKKIPHWASVGFVLGMMVAAGGIIYTFIPPSPDLKQQPMVKSAIDNVNAPVVATGAATASQVAAVAEPQGKVTASQVAALSAAQAQVTPGDATSRLKAIFAAREIKTNTPAAAAEVKKSIDKWSLEIATIADSYATKKEWQTAIKTAKMVPPEATNYAAAQASMLEWKSRL
jgi:uncharacterized caspase-like protein